MDKIDDQDNSMDFNEMPGQPGQDDFKASRLDSFLGGGGKEASSSLSFEARFQQGLRQYESLGGIINAVVVKPDNPKSDVPVILAPGWSENRKVLKGSIAALYNSGRTVIALDHPRRGGTVDPSEEYPVDELRKALTMKTIIEEDGIQQVDIISHSEGSINGAILASLESDRVRNMVLVNPAGLIGKDTIPRLVGRFVKKGVQNFWNTLPEKAARKAFNRSQTEGVKYIASNPLRAYQEVKAISSSEIEDMLRDLHDSGIGITVIGGVDDAGFPMDKLQKVVKSDAQPDGFVDGFLSVRGGHDEFHIHADKYTGAAEKMLTALEQKTENNPEQRAKADERRKRAEQSAKKVKHPFRRRTENNGLPARENRDEEIIEALRESAKQAALLRTDDDLRRTHEAHVITNQEAQRAHEIKNREHLEVLAKELETQRKEAAELKKERETKEREKQGLIDEIYEGKAGIGTLLKHPLLAAKIKLRGKHGGISESYWLKKAEESGNHPNLQALRNKADNPDREGNDTKVPANPAGRSGENKG